MFFNTYLVLLASIISAIVQAQDNLYQDSGASLRVALEKFSNVSDGGLWVLVPSNVSLDDLQINNGDYNLFKLNTDGLMSREQDDDDGGQSSKDLAAEERQSRSEQLGHRSARKMHLFKNVLNKPKVSPLYLINGTVCRFVNQQPICTTLSTTGLLRPNQGQQQQQQGGIFGQGGFFNNGQQNQQNLNQIQNGNVQQRQVTPNQPGGGQPFNQQGFNQQQGFRPAAIVDDEAADINVESSIANGNATTATINQQSSTTRPQVNRPVSFVVSRRPLNLLAFGRPFRQYQFGSRRNNYH